MIADRAYMQLSPAERLVSYLFSRGVNVIHERGHTLMVIAPVGEWIDMAAVLEALAAHNQEILALIPEVRT